MQRKWFLSLLLLVMAIAVLAFGVVSASAVAGYNLTWWTVDSGGGTSAGGSYVVSGGTFGQPDAGPQLSGGSYRLDGGFWSGAINRNLYLPVVLR